MTWTLTFCPKAGVPAPQFKQHRAFQLAVRARTSLDEALDDAGIASRSEKAASAVTSAWAGAKGAIMARAAAQKLSESHKSRSAAFPQGMLHSSRLCVCRHPGCLQCASSQPHLKLQLMTHPAELIGSAAPQARLGRSAPEAAEVGAAVGAGMQRAREASESGSTSDSTKNGDGSKDGKVG